MSDAPQLPAGRRARWLNAALLSIAVAACASGASAGGTSDSRRLNAPAAASRPARWTPSLGDTFQSQLSGSPDRTIRASVYDLDVFETTAADVAALHAQGRHVVCYIDAGSFERGRPDENAFAAVVLGATYVGYPDERWTEHRSQERRRSDLAAVALVRFCNRRRLLGTIALFPLRSDGRGEKKAVFMLEYTDRTSRAEFRRFVCPKARAGMIAVLKNRTLDAWRGACP